MTSQKAVKSKGREERRLKMNCSKFVIYLFCPLNRTMKRFPLDVFRFLRKSFKNGTFTKKENSRILLNFILEGRRFVTL